MKTVLILGSAPDAVSAQLFDLDRVNALVALNNAWSIRPDWTHAIFPEDFPAQRRPTPRSNQVLVTFEQYVPANNAYGGIIYAGPTMAFTAAYWALHQLEPDLLLFCGCDMIYDQINGQSHFYGKGAADPLRSDPTLQSLEAKSNRLMILAAEQSCACANLSDLPASRLTFPRFDSKSLETVCETDQQRLLHQIDGRLSAEQIKAARASEDHAALIHPAGDYWNSDLDLDSAVLQAIDTLWLQAAKSQSDDVIS